MLEQALPLPELRHDAGLPLILPVQTSPFRAHHFLGTVFHNILNLPPFGDSLAQDVFFSSTLGGISWSQELLFPPSRVCLAALECFDPAEHTFLPQSTIADIFAIVQSQGVTYGVVPFENSTNGSVVFTLDLFCDRKQSFPDTLVCGEAYLDVHHCLLSASNSLSSISRIYSHPQAFGQCENWLNTNLKGVERIDVSSTSKAALIVATDPDAAAIASKVAADVHGLKVLASNIEDTPDNTTRFFVLSTTRKSPVSSAPGEADKTLLSFTIDHKIPGALCDSLKVFKDFNLNLTSIASRPSRVLPWNYIFFVEFEGHSGVSEVQVAMDELRKYCLNLRILGSYRDNQHNRGQVYRESEWKLVDNRRNMI